MRQGYPRRAGSCLLAALLTWLSLPGVGWWVLALIALIPLALALRGASAGGGALLGLLYGLAFITPSIWWTSAGLVTLTHASPALAWAMTLLLILAQALPYALFGLALGFMGGRGRPPGPMRAALWLAVPVAGFPQLFPGCGAHALYRAPLFIQAADLGGWPLVLFWLCLSAWLAAGIITEPRRRGARLLALAALLALVCGYGALRLKQYGQGPAAAPGAASATVLAVQPNLPIPSRQPPGPGETVDSLLAYTARRLAEHPRAGLIVWPEVPWTLSCREDMPTGVIERMLEGPGQPRLLIPCREQIMDPKAPPKVSTHVSTGRDGEQSTLTVTRRKVLATYNAAAMWDARGLRRPLHRKVERFPFGEYLPLARTLPFLRRLFPGPPGVRAGKRPVVMDLGRGVRAAPLLCYESLHPDVALAGVAQGGNLLIAMGNDAWFESPAAGRFQLALVLFRAVECRAPLVIVSNSGPGAHIDAAGRILPGSLTPYARRTATCRALAVPPARAPYTWLRPWLGWGALLLCALDLAFCLRPRRRREPRLV